MEILPKKVLSTKILDDNLVRKASDQGIQITCIPFIAIRYIDDLPLRTAIQQWQTEKRTVIFTSSNAVNAVKAILNGYVPDWDIYCIGPATTAVIAGYFGEEKIKATAPYAAGLADIITAIPVTDPLFFCGNKRMDTLPKRLRQSGIGFTECRVYHTDSIDQTVPTVYDGAIFFSPSAVESFFESNKTWTGKVVFSIGSTTSRCLEKYTAVPVIESETTSQEAMIDTVIMYYTHSNKKTYFNQ